jgi:ZIP family zinc transporter
MVDGWSAVLLGGGASLIAGLATGVGALPALALKGIAPRTEDTLLGFAGGIMLAAMAFSLLLPALDIASARTGAPGAGAALVAAGMVLGACALWLIHRFVPHEHFIKGAEGRGLVAVRRMWLFVFAISLHNLPEGLAVGIGVSGDVSAEGRAGLAITLGIAVQNMPEGLVVALALMRERYSRATAILVALATGLIEPVGGLVGAAAVTFIAGLLPWGLAFAAGAMLWVISGEIVPETHRRGFETSATFGLMAGFVAMMVVSRSIG